MPMPKRAALTMVRMIARDNMNASRLDVLVLCKLGRQLC